MARIINTAYPASRTRYFYDDETMGEHYDPPGIHFNEDGGEVARIKQQVVDDVVTKFPTLERLPEDPDTETETASAADATDAEAESTDADADDSPSDASSDADT